MARSTTLTYQAGVPCALLLLFFSLFIVSSCKEHADAASSDHKPKGGEPPIVDVLVVSARPIANEIEANGSVVANEYVELHPEITGRIVYLNPPTATQLAKGTAT